MGVILSGMRPTGDLHLGHLVGALNTWVKMQETYKCYYMVADWHAVSTTYEDSIDMKSLKLSMIADWIACGIDPEKSVIFIQSEVKEHAELHLLLSMITPLSWVERNPSYKDMIQNLKGKNISTYGFLGYPVLQAADILIYNADSVPVGQDQLPHLELCREISRRFNYLYGDTFIEPKPILAVTPKLLGLDKRKMSKSFKNYISLSETDESIRKKINSMITDPERIRKDDPGHPEVCSVYEYHCCFLNEKSAEIEEQCRQGKIGCVACKKMLLEKLLDIIGNIREKRIKLLENRNYLLDIIETGNRKARETAAETMAKVRDNMKLSNKF